MLKLITICILFHVFNQIAMRALTLLNRNRILAYVDRYSDRRRNLSLSKVLYEPRFFRYFVQFNPGGIAYFIIRTIRLAIINKVNIIKALYIQNKFDGLFLNVSENNFRRMYKKFVKIVGE